MKKKILLTIAMVVVLFSIFAISAFAEEITYSADFGDITAIADMPTIEGIDTNARVVLKNDDGTYTTYPTYYIMQNSKTFGTDYTNLNAKTNQSYDDSKMMMIEIPDGVTGIASKLFGLDGTTHPTTSLEKIVILSDDYTKITSQTFRRMPTVKSVTIPASVITIENWTFCGSTALQEVIFDGTPLVETMGNSFSGCTALSSINLGDCTNLKSISGSFNGCTSLRKLSLPDSLEEIGAKTFYKIGEFELESDYLPSNLKTLGTHFLSGCTIVNEVLYFPEGVTDMGASYHFNDGFAVNTKLTLVFLGKMTNINLSSSTLSNCFTNKGDKKPLTIVLAQNAYEELNGNFVQGVDYDGKLAYIGSEGTYTAKTEGALTVSLCNNDPNNGTQLTTDEDGNIIYSAENAPASLIFCGYNDNTVKVCYSVRNNITMSTWSRLFTTEWTYDVDAHKAADVHYNNVVYQEGNCGYDEKTTSTCVICKLQSFVDGTLATGEHTYTDDGNCETAVNCEVCKKTVIEALSHTITTVIEYKDGFIADGVKTESCSNEGCKHVNVSEANKIFDFSGVSTKISDTVCGITLGYNINKSALNEYEAVCGALKYGFVSAFEAKLNGNEPIANGKKAEIDGCNIIMVDASVNDSAYSRVDFVLKGEKTLWENDQILVDDKTLAEARIVLAGYVIDADNNVTYFNSTCSSSAFDFTSSYASIE